MLLASKSGLDVSFGWLALSGVEMGYRLSTYQSSRQGAPQVFSCPNLDASTTQLYQCDLGLASMYPTCEVFLNSGVSDVGNGKKSRSCVHLATLNSISQQATIFNNQNTSAKWNVAFNTTSETISIAMGDDVLQKSEDSIISEYFELAPHKSVSFPFAMFVSPTHTVPNVMYKTELAQNLQMCYRLSQVWEQFQLPTSTFMIQSDNTYVHSEHSLLHYMDLCSIHAPTVYMYHSDSDGFFYTEVSRCTVLKVTGVDSVDCVGDSSNSSISVDTCVNSPIGPVHPVCIQDVMYHLTTNSTPLHYVSSVGYSNFVHPTDFSSGIVRSGRREFSVLGFRDLLAVLHAYTTTEFSVPLVLHSVSSVGTSDAAGASSIDTTRTKLARTLSRQLLSVMMILTSDTDPAAAFQRSLTPLNNTLDTLFYTSHTAYDAYTIDNFTSALPLTWYTHAALLDTLTLHFGEGGTKFVHHCANQEQGSVVSYVCATHSARVQLRDLIGSYISTGVSNGTSDVAQLVAHITTIINTLTYSATHATHTTHTTQSKPNPPQVNVVVAGDVFVMMFVRPAHVPLVQELVYHWQRGGADHTNFLYVRYMIFPVYGSKGSSGSSGVSDSIYDTPSLYSVLSIVEESIQHIAAVKDIIYVLNGMHAILSFPQPGRTLPDNEQVLRKQCSAGSVNRDSVVCDANVVDGYGGSEECNLCKYDAYTTHTTITSTSSADSTYATHTTHSYTPYTTSDTCAFIEGAVPSVPYGWSALLRLQAGVVVGASSSVYSGGTSSSVYSGGNSGSGNGRGSEAPWNFNTMVGVGYRLLDMITTVRGTNMGINKYMGGSNSDSILTEALLHDALRTYAETHPTDVILDCNQHAFHTTKGNMLTHMLYLQQKRNYVSYTMLPYLRHVYSMKASNDSVASIASVLGVVLYYGSTIVSTSRKHSAGYSGLHYTNYTQDSLLYSYRKYRPALNTILHAYIDSTDEYASLARILSGDVAYSELLIPLMKTDRIPLGTHYISTTVKPSSGVHECYIEQSMLQSVSAHIFHEMYMQSDTTAAVLSIIGLLHQSIVCQCEDLAYALDEAVYTFIRIGQLAKYVTFSIEKNEYIIASALLENYETMLLGLFNGNVTSSGSISGVSSGSSGGMSGNSKYSSAHNPIYGTVLHNTSTVFTHHVRYLYNTLAPFYQDQILVSVRFAIAGLAQELAVQPPLVHSMHSAYKTAGYVSVSEGRKEWYKQREVLRESLRRDSGDSNIDNIYVSLNNRTSTTTDTVIHNTGITHTSFTPHTPNNTTATATAIPNTTTTTPPPLPTIRTHYVTYGSDLTEGLQNLLDSAELAGVTIEVLGLGTHYADYMSKTDAYLNYLINSTGPHTRGDTNTVYTSNTNSHTASTNTNNTNITSTFNTNTTTFNTTATPVPEDDVVIFMDAYDVLVFPSIVKAARVLAQSRSPIVFCAERGVYPEFAGSFFYNRGAAHAYNTTYTYTTHPNTNGEVDLAHTAEGGVSTVESSSFSQKFLNSGCVLGRAGQMRHILQYAKNYSRTYRDDQLAMVRYHHENPSLVAIDNKNTLFATSFKLATAPQDMLLTYDLRLYQGDANIGLLHCNNHKSGIVYPSMVHNMKTIRHMYYQGEEGELLLQAIHHYSHNRLDAATTLLQHPTILNNCTSSGGANPIRLFILNRIQKDRESGSVGGNHRVLV